MNDKMFYENISKQMQEDKEKIKQLEEENKQLKKQLEHYKTQEIERINKNLLDAENNYLERYIKAIR